MTPRNADGPGVAHPEPATSTNPVTAKIGSRDQGSAATALLLAYVTVLLAGPAAVFDRLMITNCPLGCGNVHICHVPAGAWRRAEPIVRAPRCAPHRRMELRVVAVLPAVPAIAGQRRRGAA